MNYYEQLKQMAKDAGLRVTDMIALAPQNDPFYTGTPAEVEAADWFAGSWRKFGYTTGVHLRRVHYQLVSQAGTTKPNGAPYENTENDWGFLCNAGKWARILGKIDPLAFVDRRNPDPHVFADYTSYWLDTPDVRLPASDFQLPAINPNLEYDLELESPSVIGYDYGLVHQPYHAELWVEKSTMNDVLLPLGREWGINVVTSLGFQSITGAIAMLQRIAQSRKPARIFYISDFDPAGDGMPVAVARQVEYWLAEYAPDADIKLLPLVLTREQVETYDLPRTPVKETDKRKAHFEEQHGEGAVELDALEALYPGELARIVGEAIMAYRDTELEKRLQETRDSAEGDLREMWGEYVADEADELGEVAGEVNVILARYRERLEALRDELECELSPLRERVEDLGFTISAKRETFQFSLPERPIAYCTGDNGDGWLFDSDRSYLTQLEVYKEHQGKL